MLVQRTEVITLRIFEKLNEETTSQLHDNDLLSKLHEQTPGTCIQPQNTPHG
jgi:hypothetical protein